MHCSIRFNKNITAFFRSHIGFYSVFSFILIAGIAAGISMFPLLHAESLLLSPAISICSMWLNLFISFLFYSALSYALCLSALCIFLTPLWFISIYLFGFFSGLGFAPGAFSCLGNASLVWCILFLFRSLLLFYQLSAVSLFAFCGIRQKSLRLIHKSNTFFSYANYFKGYTKRILIFDLGILADAVLLPLWLHSRIG